MIGQKLSEGYEAYNHKNKLVGMLQYLDGNVCYDMVGDGKDRYYFSPPIDFSHRFRATIKSSKTTLINYLEEYKLLMTMNHTQVSKYNR